MTKQEAIEILKRDNKGLEVEIEKKGYIGGAYINGLKRYLEAIAMAIEALESERTNDG